MVSEIRGKLNGTVLARNRYSAYARTKVIPRNPKTPAQQQNRTIFSKLSKEWRNILQVERNAWNLAVNDFLRTNIFGDTYKPSGFNLFMRINLNRFNIGYHVLTKPPKPTVINSIRIIKIKIDAASNNLIAIIESNTTINHYPIVYVTRPLSPGINFVKSELRMIKFTYSPISSPPNRYILNLGTQYKDKFGNLSNFIGQTLFFKVIPIDILTGLNGIPKQEKVIIQ